MSHFCDDLVVPVPAIGDLCWSLEELQVLKCSLPKPGDFPQRGTSDMKLGCLTGPSPFTVRTTGDLSSLVFTGAHVTVCSGRASPHWLRCSARTKGCWSSPSSEITKVWLALSFSNENSMVFEPLTKLLFRGKEPTRQFFGLWLWLSIEDMAPKCLEESKDLTCLQSGELVKNPK